MVTAPWSGFLSTAEAVALIQPFVGAMSAHHLLVDLRRRDPSRRRRTPGGISPPAYICDGGRVWYPRREIDRLIKALRRLRR